MAQWNRLELPNLGYTQFSEHARFFMMTQSAPEKIDEIIRLLPPEEREHLTVKDGEIFGPEKLVAKVRELAKDRSGGVSGD